MADINNNSLLNLGDYSKAAELLINRISDAVGGVFAPWQIKRIAAAEAQALVIHAEADIKINDLQKRAAHRLLEEEARCQFNLESVIRDSLPYLAEDSQPGSLETDWLTHFAQRAKYISDGDMQGVWARVLAGESNKKGSFSKRTLSLVADLEKDDAVAFQKVCAFRAHVSGTPEPTILDVTDEIYVKNGVDFETLVHLNSLGLIHYDEEYQYKDLAEVTTVTYCGDSFDLILPQQGNSYILSFGSVMLTKFGTEIAGICDQIPVDGFFDYLRTRLTIQVETDRRIYSPPPISHYPPK